MRPHANALVSASACVRTEELESVDRDQRKRRNRRDSTRTAKKKAGRQAIHLVPSSSPDMAVVTSFGLHDADDVLRAGAAYPFLQPLFFASDPDKVRPIAGEKLSRVYSFKVETGPGVGFLK
jgi:hypothetical protein